MKTIKVQFTVDDYKEDVIKKFREAYPSLSDEEVNEYMKDIDFERAYKEDISIDDEDDPSEMETLPISAFTSGFAYALQMSYPDPY